MGDKLTAVVVLMVVILACVQTGWCQRTNFQKKEKEVLDNILKTYDPRIRPTGTNTSTDSSAAVVAVNMYLLSLEKVDDLSMDYSIQLYLRQEWNDERFKYSDNGGLLKHLIVENSRKIWTPDIFFVNEKQGSEHNLVKPNYFIRVYPNGNVLYSTRLSLTLSCPMNLSWFPFDRQICKMRLESYGWTSDGLMLKWKDLRPVEITTDIHLPTFVLDKWETEEKHFTLTTGEYSILELDLHLHRQLNYYLVNIVIPCAMLVILSWVAFWMDPTSITARTVVGVSTLLTMAMQISAFNSKLPPVSYTKSIDYWTGVCLTFAFVAFLETASVNYLARYETKQQAKDGDKCDTLLEDASAIDMKPLVSPAKGEAKDEPKEGNSRSNTLRLRERANEYKSCISKILTRSKKLDIVSRVLFPVVFILFTILYFLVNAFH